MKRSFPLVVFLMSFLFSLFSCSQLENTGATLEFKGNQLLSRGIVGEGEILSVEFNLTFTDFRELEHSPNFDWENFDRSRYFRDETATGTFSQIKNSTFTFENLDVGRPLVLHCSIKNSSGEELYYGTSDEFSLHSGVNTVTIKMYSNGSSSSGGGSGMTQVTINGLWHGEMTVQGETQAIAFFLAGNNKAYIAKEYDLTKVYELGKVYVKSSETSYSNDETTKTLTINDYFGMGQDLTGSYTIVNDKMTWNIDMAGGETGTAVLSKGNITSHYDLLTSSLMGRKMLNALGAYKKLDNYISPCPPTIGTWEYVSFGTYPQTVDNPTIIEDMIVGQGGLAYCLGIDSNGDYYWYYKLEKATPSTETGAAKEFEDGNAIETNETYYFKVEPIKWRVLTTNGDEKLLLAERAIATEIFYDDTTTKRYDTSGNEIVASDYENSRIRAFLNGMEYLTETDASGTPTSNGKNSEFNAKGILWTAFTSEVTDNQIGKVVEKELGTDTSGGKTTYNDKVFLLSFYGDDDQLRNSEYGFDSNSYNDTAQYKTPTDYAAATGAAQNGPQKQCRWWTRSKEDATTVIDVLSIGGQGKPAYYEKGEGVVPAIWVNVQ